MHPFQWTLFIGPAWHPASSPYFYNWQGFTPGGASAVDYQSTLVNTLGSGVTSLVLANGTPFQSAGGLWIGPNGSNQAWEYVDYSARSGNTISGLVREPAADREHNGVHSAGAVVRQWWHATSNDGRLQLDMSLDELMVATDWQFGVSGIAAPQVALRPLHLAAIQCRAAVTGTLLDMLVGFVDTSTIRDDAKRVRAWSMRGGSIANLLRRIDVEGVRMGEFDAASHGSARSSTPLGAAHKERWSGDFVASNPSFAPDVVMDDEGDGVWIGDRYVGPTETTGAFSGISQVYIHPPISINRGARWIEIVNRNTASLALAAYDADLGSEHMLNLPSETLGPGERMIIAENEGVFLRENPSHEAKRIFDVSGSDFPNWFNRLKPGGGAVAIKFMSSYSSAVYWGTVTPATTGWAAAGWTNPGGTPASSWTGASIAGPDYDETLRYKMLSYGNPNSRDDWEVSRRQSPGYTISTNSRGDQAWIAIDLPGMGLVLHEDITNSTPGGGATLLIDGQNGPSTDGLPNSGTLVIGDEYITYSAKVAGGVTVTARGVSGTAATSHLAGDAIFVVHTQGGRTMVTDAMPLSALVWERSGGTIYPRDFRWRYSAVAARTPDERLFEDDYEVEQIVTGHASSSYTMALSNQRAATILLEFRRMTVDPARPRVNRIKAVVDPAYFDSTQWLSSGQTVEQLIQRVGINAGLISGIVVVTGGGAAPSGFSTAIDGAWSVMASVAEMGGSWIQVARDSQIYVRPDSFWLEAIGNYTPVKTWTRANASSVEYVRNAGGMVSQVKIHWQKPDGSESGEVVYPATPDDLGSVQEIGPLYFANSAGATIAARKRYFMSRYPYQFQVTLAQGDLSIEPRQVHQLTWQLADDMQPVDRMMMVTSVSHLVDGMTLSTVLFGQQIDHEWGG